MLLALLHCTNNAKMLQTLTKSSEVTSGIRDACMGLIDLGLVPFWDIRQDTPGCLL